MLALKNVLTAGEDVGMLIFDEDRHRRFRPCGSTDRPQAVCHCEKEADTVRYPSAADCRRGRPSPAHFKSVRDGRSYTDVSPMDRAHRVDEIARLLSGEEISDAARRNAEEHSTQPDREREPVVIIDERRKERAP